jgi:hypothetical protein
LVLLATETPDAVKLEIICRTFEPAIVMLSALEATFVLPAASDNASATTATSPTPPRFPDAVNVTVRVVPVVVKLDSEPRVAVKSSSVKSVTLSLSVMVMLHVALAA